MTITAIARQTGTSTVAVSWTSTDPDPALGFRIDLILNGGAPKEHATVRGLVRGYTDRLTAADNVVVGDVLEYVVTDLDTVTSGTAPPLTYRDLDEPFTFGPVDPLITTPTYTDIATMKRRLGIDPSDVTADDDLTAAAISAQIQIDQRMARSLPDTGANPEIPGIPQPIRDLALTTAIRIYKRADAPFGSAGADALLGAITTDNELARMFREDPLFTGYVVARGVG